MIRRVLHVIPSLQKGGAERLALDICIELNKRKDVEVKLFTLHNNISFEIPDFVDYIPASISLSLTRKNSYNLSQLEYEIKSFQPEIIHTHLFEADIITRSIVYPRAAWFSHLHDNMPQLENFSITSFISKKLVTNFYEKHYFFKQCRLNKGNHFICISNDTLSFANRVIKNRFKYSMLFNAINFNKFFATKTYVKKANLNLINVGSFQAKKNQQFLITVVELLKQKNIRVQLHLLGNGALFEEVKLKALNLDLVNEVVFHCNVNQVEDYLKEADIYVHSAYYEPFGLVLIEAMAAGLPVITLDGKGNRDLIHEGENGYMIYEQDAELFANTIVKLWNNQKKMNKISKKANEFAKGFDIVNYVDKLIMLYENAIKLK